MVYIDFEILTCIVAHTYKQVQNNNNEQFESERFLQYIFIHNYVVGVRGFAGLRIEKKIYTIKLRIRNKIIL